MTIEFNEKQQQFHLYNDYVSYIMEVYDNKYLLHVYYGDRINAFLQKGSYPKGGRSSFSPNPAGYSEQGFSLNVALQECPGNDTGDYREGMAEFTFKDGTKAVNFAYVDYEIEKGKPTLKGLPATYVEENGEAETLTIKLRDHTREVDVELCYTIYANRPIVTRSVKYINSSLDEMILEKALSGCVEFSDSTFDLIQLPGAWANEKQIKRNPITRGIHVLDSKRGASGIAQQPFMALARPETTESNGEVYGFHLVYSGNFKCTAEVDQFQQTRALIGINSHNFSWVLAPSDSFQSPEVVMVYSNEGLNGMSRALHELYIERLARGKYRNQQRPVLINNWETTYFDFNERKIIELARKSKEIGVELFVLDDGWFGKRTDDTSSLGDWFESKEKLPNGLKKLSERIHEEGLQFGLWFEPEMISEKSELFEIHPDWHIHVTDYPSSYGRNQLVLDFSRKEVVDEIYNQMCNILDNVPIDYIKWDMNRNMTEIGSLGREPKRQRETAHRYILNLYELLEKLTSRYPNILFENCSGGSGRFDPGMCYYMPQSWSSDNTDALERLNIQYATSLIFPPVMMCAQLSESPNDQVGRITDIESRAAIATSANFGIMLDLTKKDEEGLSFLKQSIEEYKNARELIQFGKFYRLKSPFEGNYGCWQFIDRQKNEGRLVFFQILSKASKPWEKVKLQGLDAEAVYQLNDDRVMSGDELMKYGLFLNQDLLGDFKSKVLTFKKNESLK